jgi:hypothetical protein
MTIKVRRKLLELIENPLGKRFLENYYGIPVSEMKYLSWSKFPIRGNDYFIDDHVYIRRLYDTSYSYLHFKTLNGDYHWVNGVVTSDKSFPKDVIRLLWGFCNGVFLNVADRSFSPEFCEYLLKLEYFTETSIIRGGYGRTSYYYDTFSELVVKNNKPRHKVYNTKPRTYNFDTDLVVFRIGSKYNVKEALRHKGVSAIGSRSKFKEQISSAILVTQSELPILANRELQRNVKSANK